MVITLKPAKIAFYLLMAAIVVIAVIFMKSDNKEEKAETASSEGDFVLVIDPGHGGGDGGAISLTGSSESAINLEIALKMRAIANLTATPCVMTRESEDIEYPESARTVAQRKLADQKSRIELIESTPGAVLISVHQNKYPAPQPRGPQAFYVKDELSAELATMAQELLTRMLYPENRRVAAPVPDNVYLFKHVSCPAILAECGFLSNAQESRLLEEDSHQIKAALALMSAYFRFTGTQPQLS